MTDNRAKLTEEQVQHIRSRYSEGGCTQQGLADEYQVSNSQINKIIQRDHWRNEGEISIKRPPIRYRKENLVKPLRCPVCNGELIYDTAYCDLMCKRKIEGKCKFGISIVDDRDEPEFLWSVRGNKEKISYRKFGELVKEVNRRRSIQMQLANNLITVLRDGDGGKYA